MTAHPIIICLLLPVLTPGARFDEPELILSLRMGGSSGRGVIITEPLWPALFYRNQNFDPIAVLFEDFEIPFDFPVMINDTVSAVNDPDFPGFVELITDGVADPLLQGAWSASGAVLGSGGGPDPDLSGYEIDHITQILTVMQESPGQDLNGDGIWTDWTVQGVYEFYGNPVVPEPTTLALLALGVLPLVAQSRSRSGKGVRKVFLPANARTLPSAHTNARGCAQKSS